MSFTVVELSYGMEKVENAANVWGNVLGTRGVTPDGRVFRLSKAGEALGAGYLCQGPLAIANHDMDLAVQTAGSVGDTEIKVTLGGTASTKDQYADGYIHINDGAGEGHMYHLARTHDAVSSAATFTATLATGETVREALTTAASLAGLKANPYNGTLLCNTTPDGIPRGVAPIEVTSDYYFWLQTWGQASVLINGTVVLGKTVSPGLTTSGSVDAFVSGGSNAGDIGFVESPISVTTDYGDIYLRISP